MTFGQSIKTCFTKYATFKGRATRSEFWWWQLFVVIVLFIWSVVITVIISENSLDSDVAGVFITIFGLPILGLIAPSISVFVRRLHDIGKSGWWWWITLLPYIGFIIHIVFGCIDTQPEDNKYGVNPKTNLE